MNHLTQAPENNTRVISNFFENSWRYSQVKVHHQCQHRWQIAASINDTSDKFAPCINDTGGKFCHQFPLFATGVVDTAGKQWEQYQAAGTLK